MYKVETGAKALFASVFAAVTVRLGAVGGLLALFAVSVALDYFTGIAAAVYHKQLDSGVGLRGILKKVGECVIIAVAFLADEIVAQAGAQLGLTLSTGGALAALVVTWLILNELISILENIDRMNVPLPSFLLAAIRLLKKHTEAKGGDSPPAE